MTGGDRATRSREAAVPIAVGILVAASVLAVGGAHPTTQVLLSAAALLLLVGYVATRGARGIRPVAFAGAAALALGYTLFQLLPLPAPLVEWLSPVAYELRQETSSRRLIPLTVDASATWLAVARGATCLALLLVVAGSIRSRRSVRRYLWIVVAAGVTTALLALVQRALGVESILGIYRPRSMPGFGVFGTFVDVNHAASLLALAALIASGLAVESRGRARTVAIVMAVASGGALMTTSSRAGLAATAVAGAALVVILVARSAGPLRAIVAASVILLVCASAALWLNEGLRARISGPTQQLWTNQKVRGWGDGLRLAAEYRWTGVGRGAFEAPLNRYRTDDEGVRLVYPENLLVQMASEWGLPITLALVLMVLATSRRLLGSFLRLSPAGVAAGCGVLAVVLHDLADFGLEMPGVAVPTMVALAALVGSTNLDERRTRARRGPRLAPPLMAPLVVAWAGALVGAVWATRHTSDADFARANGTRDADALAADIARHPADDYFELLAAQDAMRQGSPTAMHHLNRALRLHPANAQAHRMAARLLAALHRPTQAALEYRLAAETGLPVADGELLRVLGANILDAVPRRPASLVELARSLYGMRRNVEADAALRRAVDLASDDAERWRVTRVRTVLEFSDRQALAPAANDLLSGATQVDSFVVAAQALARAHDQARANAAIEAGLHAHVQDGTLLLAGARLRLDAGDLGGARAMLGRGGNATLSLAQRQQAEELLAQIADKAGDVDTAVLARARARLIAQQLRDMSPARSMDGRP